ncbi:MAG TPA: substrate-binding domain-containing protein, partial [Xanthobacteraceae bacterium]
STIVSTPGLKVAGPLPPPLLGVEAFSAGLLTGSTACDAAVAFLAALRSPASDAIWTAAGFETAPTRP